jgi:pimeloyl-ACP methyl ester carboxylesterase
MLALAMLGMAGTAQAGCLAPTQPVANGPARLVASLAGQGSPVLLIPSLGRAPVDYDALGLALVRPGFQVIRYEPRWFGASDGPEAATLADLGEDAAAVASTLCPGIKVAVVGHALGNRVARAMAAAHPDRVSTLILLAAGGQVPIAPDVARAIGIAAAQGQAGTPERLKALQLAFFAPGHDPTAWLGGWSARAATLQAKAVQGTSEHGWQAGGQVPMLVVQPSQDPVAPLANAQALAATPGLNVTIVRLDRASHAILPEQPSAVAAAVSAWLSGERRQPVLQKLVDKRVIR